MSEQNNYEKIIETDEDTLLEDQNDNGGSIYPFDPINENIEISENPFSIFEYLRQLNKGKINIHPEFQRNSVWKDEQKCKFIESILLNFPLPPIYLNETMEASYLVIDGLQRSTTLREYYADEFALYGLEALPSYNGKKYSDLPEKLQSKFENKKLATFVLKPSTPMVVIYDLFKRINTGGTQLNRQEVRNCIFIGKSTELLKELANEECFQKAIDYGVTSKRMKDREIVLRYLAFRWFDYKTEYTGDMSDFIENAMKMINKFSDEKINNIKHDFKRVMKIAFRIWDIANFRIPTEATRGTINTAVLETVCNYLSVNSDEYIINNLHKIKKNYSDLIMDPVYNDAVTKSTGNKTRVLSRFKLVFEILNRGLER
jgi:uncharacterized protein with ParB-like and HNH nuclease domain